VTVSLGSRGESASVSGVLLRFATALVLVYATYNPEGYSYVDWLLRSWPGAEPATPASWTDTPALKFLVGIVLTTVWVIYLNAARRSLGAVGVVLVTALCAGLVWLLVSWQVIPADSVRVLTHITLVIVAIVLAVGLSWSHFSRRLSGQVDTDVVD
jgi:hypothetical protein